MLITHRIIEKCSLDSQLCFVIGGVLHVCLRHFVVRPAGIAQRSIIADKEVKENGPVVPKRDYTSLTTEHGWPVTRVLYILASTGIYHYYHPPYFPLY